MTPLEIIMSSIAIAGPTIRAGTELYETLRNQIAKARASNLISHEQQDLLMERVEQYRHIAESNTYEPHWYPAGTQPLETAVK